ncbi:MAG TPA: hypothetical protein VKN99_10320 [Polyangia bacterium]|nr:hypothetical protein [Polyangia bacterium]
MSVALGDNRKRARRRPLPGLMLDLLGHYVYEQGRARVQAALRRARAIWARVVELRAAGRR